MKIISFFQKYFLFLMAASLPMMASCGGGSDTPSCGGESALSRASDSPDEEPEVITAPFSGTSVFYYTVDVAYFDEAGEEIFSKSIESGDPDQTTTGCGNPHDDYSARYTVEEVPDNVRQTMIDLGLWDIGQSYSEFAVTELMNIE